LWNLTIGAVLRWSPLPEAISLQLMLMAMAVCTVGMLSSTLLILTGSRWLAIGGSVIAMGDPQVLVNLTEPTYEMATTLGLVSILWLTVRQPRSIRFSLSASVCVGTAIVMTRALFHPLWLVLLVALLAWTYRIHIGGRAIATMCLIPVVVVGGWMLKNYVLFDTPTLSSWSGMNLQRAVVQVAPDRDLQDWYARGEISEISVLYPSGFSSYPNYAELVPACQARHAHPALSTFWHDSTQSSPNFNAECYLPVFDRVGRDALAIIENHPTVFLSGRWWAARAWFVDGGLPITEVSPIYKGLRQVYGVLDLAVPARLPGPRFAGGEFGTSSFAVRTSLTNMLLTALVLGKALRAAARRLRRLPASRFALLDCVAGLIVGWNILIGVLFELGEQPRFRTVTDPITTALGVRVCWQMWSRWKRGRGQASSPVPTSAGAVW
jgi:hypothetical protein